MSLSIEANVEKSLYEEHLENSINTNLSSISSNITTLSSNITTLNYFIHSSERTCAQLGMVANDSASYTSNYTIICDTLNNDIKILVDNKYYLSRNENSFTDGTDITADITFEGVTLDAELCFTGSGDRKAIDVLGSNINLKNLRITTHLTSNYTWVFMMRDGLVMDSIIVDNCYFSGNLRLFTWDFTNDIYLDPSSSFYGISLFKFNNNRCENLKFNGYGFMLFDNVPITYGEINHNYIKNFQMVFFNQGIVDDPANAYEVEQSDLMAFLRVEGNTVFNDLTYDGCPAPLTNTYHCFVLYEGNRCEYIDNSVKGLHTFSSSTTATAVTTVVYDAYLSCCDLVYIGNTWKNNIAFDLDKTSNVLMKSKKYNKSSYIGTRRIYKNNTFKTDLAYLSAINTANGLSLDPNTMWVDLTYFQDELEEVIIENNYVDVYELTQTYDQEIHRYLFNNNTILATLMKDTTNCILPMHPLTTADNNGFYEAKNNIWLVSSYRTTASGSYNKNFLVCPTISAASSVKTAKVIFNDNYIEWPNLAGFVGNNVSGNQMTLTEVEMINNKIKTTNPGSSSGMTLSTTLSCIIRKFTFDNIVELNMDTSGYKFIPTPRGGHEYLDWHAKYITFRDTSSTTSPFIAVNYYGVQELLTSGVTYYNKVDLKCLHTTGYEDFSFYFSHYYDTATSTAANCVYFISTADSTGTTLSSASSTITSLSGGETYNNYYVQLSGNTTNFNIQFKNSGNDVGFYLLNSITANDCCSYDLTITQVKNI